MDFLSSLLNLPDNKEKMMATWQEFASSHHLHFIPASPFGGPQIIGNYKGFSLKLSTNHTKNSYKGTYVELSVNTLPTNNRLPRSKKQFGEQLAVKVYLAPLSRPRIEKNKVDI